MDNRAAWIRFESGIIRVMVDVMRDARYGRWYDDMMKRM